MFELLQHGLISHTSLLINYYSSIGMNENQLAIALIVLKHSNAKKHIFTPKDFEQFMSISESEIDIEINNLVEMKLVEVNFSKNVIMIAPMLKKIITQIETEKTLYKDDINFDFVKEYLNHKLSEKEIGILNTYVEDGISRPKINDLMKNSECDDFASLITVLKAAKSKMRKVFTQYDWNA
ncbi:DnaD family protein [Spiroplasma endosymbiont of Othius punctulatus]|uniref:DnaD family protein n=1 Tax=Spiroplasma endosymbiont of Othius punctulatus TaxID=3066289 RepID=UPI0030CCD112